MSRSIRLVAVLVIAALYFGFPNARPDQTQFNAHDSEIYLALSYGLGHGLGYTRGWAAGLYTPHTTFPPGVPLLMLPATLAMGMPVNWLVVKLYMACVGLLGALIIRAYVRRITADPIAADLAAGLVALAPFYWMFSHAVMSEVPSIAFGFLALLLVDTVWSRRSPSLGLAALAGVAAGVGMMIRGTMVGLLVVPLAYAIGARGSTASPGRLALSWGSYALGFLALPLLWFARNRTLDTTGLGLDGINQVRMLLARDPIDPASPLRGTAELLADAAHNVLYHVIYRVPEQMIPGIWNSGFLGRPGMAILALALSALVVGLCLLRFTTVLPIVFMIVPQVAIQVFYAWGGSARFWVPVTTAMLVMLAISLAPFITRLAVRARTALASGLLAACAANTLVFILNHERAPSILDYADLMTLYQMARDIPDRPSPLLTEHAPLYAFITGDAGPRPIQPRTLGSLYRGITVRDGGGPHTYNLTVPPGAKELARSGAWRLLALEEPMTDPDLFQRFQRKGNANR